MNFLSVSKYCAAYKLSGTDPRVSEFGTRPFDTNDRGDHTSVPLDSFEHFKRREVINTQVSIIYNTKPLSEYLVKKTKW